MEQIPVIGFSAWSETGKTTLIEKLVVELKSRGLRVAVVKHDAHEFEIDKPGKDSWRFAQAGADVTVICSATKSAIIEYRACTFHENLARIRDVDLILVEGYTQEDIPRIGISRKATGKQLRAPVETFAAVVTDEPALCEGKNVPCFALEDIAALADFVISLLIGCNN